MSTPDIDTTKEERNAIATLRRLGNRWPEGLWLYSASGTIHVMRTGENGEQVHGSNGGIDPDYSITGIEGIPNDGGDW